MFRRSFTFLSLAAVAAASQATIISKFGNDTLTGNRPTNLLVNGSFETAAGPNTGYWATGTALAPTTTISGWTASGQVGSYAIWGNNGANIVGSAPLPHGSNGLYFGAGIMQSVAPFPTYAPDGKVGFPGTPVITPKPTTGPVTLEQTVTGLTAGGIYNLDFWTSGENVGTPEFAIDGFFGLDITGENTQYFAAPSGNSAIGNSQRYHVKFSASASTLTFKFTNWGHYFGPGGLSDELVLDDVILNEAVPEPSSWLAAGFGLAMLGLRRVGKR